RPVPGAMDDLAGVGILMGLGNVLAQDNPLATTEVVILATGAEEAGLRGADQWARAHREEIAKVPTNALVIDGVYDEKHLRVVRRELFTLVRHDPGLVELATRVAQDRGRKMQVSVVPIGASDATVFSRAGIKSTLLMCQDISRLVPNYHTRNDVLEHVQPRSLTVVLQVVKDMLVALDRGEGAGPL
ncbi:MAG: M20/M25/M40 family metallo-hydrolase, partial [Deltaproteobacteria bacterium]|nr:M20/M25/M40 family metallo-hydrolase [Deltaproteobacteria bacterium]